MDTHQIKAEVDKNIEKLATLRDEVRLRLHLASLEAKKEWDEKLAPKVVEVEGAAKNLTEQSKNSLNELVMKMEQFVSNLRKSMDEKKGDKPPPSTH